MLALGGRNQDGGVGEQCLEPGEGFLGLGGPKKNARTFLRGGRYDSGEDRSPSPEPPGPRVFSRAIRVAPFPARFRQPANLAKYSGETNPELWLAD